MNSVREAFKEWVEETYETLDNGYEFTRLEHIKCLDDSVSIAMYVYQAATASMQEEIDMRDTIIDELTNTGEALLDKGLQLQAEVEALKELVEESIDFIRDRVDSHWGVTLLNSLRKVAETEPPKTDTDQ
jgi:hypothetical protein